ncbi:MAG: hypothetical protein A2868_04145 [Candidatus Levybacteria bacterium RIFCSPHIGHO2_01_FULL_40_15b]|nr:MAG: hypothetical protein A2868_04145 [Candidatus Levybacteria bacterium RIFCSPHIGHO2_01_FULL_40_15b]
MRNWFIIFSEAFVDFSVGLIVLIYADIQSRPLSDLFSTLTIKASLVIFSLVFAKRLRDEADKKT